MTRPLKLAEILAVLDESRSVPDLQRYFLGVGGVSFSGGQFERLGGSGYRPEVANTITADDLIAVQMLSVQVSPRRALDLLQGQLGRKRPKLVPVYDEVVSCAYGTAAGFRKWLHGRLGEDDGVLPQRLRSLHAMADLPAVVSPLRVLDAVFWMRHRDGHGGTGCPGLRLS
ncbi:DUF6308 family protein [Micromonospora arida]|uniref:DUF6308 family protein n=1 Tax=Micromonospora arida TaxID=2203715 RepID=UPI0033A9AB17